MGFKVFRDRDFISGLALLIFATWVYIETMKIPATEKMILMRATFFPYLISLGFFLVGLILVMLPYYRKTIDLFELGSTTTDIKILLVFIIIIFIYLYVLELLGYFTSTICFLFGLMLLLGVKNKLYAFLLSVGITLIIYLAFGWFLKVPLPEGILSL
ncbi:Protein of unknown function DUF1468 [Moorella glycerini]|uniref:Tripartite tricarboxylate transporter TctB family protein n=1 Tax=Neomoorella stamsii TaxID=1266720 RepID=A0A9X7P7A6_9FIRM|nr:MULTISPECIES: tripartite tricarboxylate transporter TctB family protein [Moorella]PRR76422.1 Tripartite tricarboxylate transporter TctB family protein [Moorella stamsii]CEP67009.1 Protein of unknown function DUF1468 [Moorella glycerini]